MATSASAFAARIDTFTSALHLHPYLYLERRMYLYLRLYTASDGSFILISVWGICRLSRQINGQTNGQTYGQAYGQINGQTNKWQINCQPAVERSKWLQKAKGPSIVYLFIYAAFDWLQLALISMVDKRRSGTECGCGCGSGSGSMDAMCHAMNFVP